MQKQFEKSFDIPYNADVEAMASFITPAHMLVVEIPLNPNFQQLSTQMDHLNVNNNLNDQRRLSFSLNKFNTLNSQGGLLSTSNNLSSLPPPGQPVRRTSITKTTTTTTGSTGLPPEATELLRSADTTTGGTHTYSTRVTERRGSNTGNQQIIINEPPPSTTSTRTLTSAGNINIILVFRTTETLFLIDLANLPIEIPPELLATGGTITIQKRKVSVTKTTDPNASHPVSAPISNSNDTHFTTTNTLTQPQSQQQSNTSERRSSKVLESIFFIFFRFLF